MTPAPARLGLLFALTLALPALFAGTWAWLLPGGVVERTRQGERNAAEQALARAAAAFAEALQAAALQAEVPLHLDAERRVLAPFDPRRSEPDATTPITVAEQAAGSRLAAADAEGALPFFGHAANDGTLSPEGSLAYVRLLAARDPMQAKQHLDRALEQHAAARCAGLPFPLLATLATVDWLPDAGGPSRAVLRERAFAWLPEVPAEAVPPLADALAAALPEAANERLAGLRAAAATALRHRDTPAPGEPAAGPAGEVLVPLGADRLAVLTPATVNAARQAACALAAADHPGFAIDPNQPADAEAPRLVVPSLGTTWSSHAVGTPASVLLAIAGRTSLALALLTLVFGNLLLWRLTRREMALVRLRADFVDVVSHELRTPLTALSLKAEMLANGDVPGDRVPHYLRMLHGDVRRLADQVERILDFGRLEKGAVLRHERLPARAVVARGVRAGRAALQVVGQQLTVEAPRRLPEIVGDVDVLQRALRNLLENAAKYAPPGSTVAVRAFADHDELVIEVADRGPGVPAAERAGIFQPFVRGSGASPGTPGSGLGLALVAAAARVHRGRVDVREREGGGAVFTLRLPVVQEAAS